MQQSYKPCVSSIVTLGFFFVNIVCLRHLSGYPLAQQSRTYYLQMAAEAKEKSLKLTVVDYVKRE